MKDKLVFKNSAIDKKIFTAVSLFCGAGGLDMGFERQGFKVVGRMI